MLNLKMLGIKDVDREILNKLDDKELLKACTIDKYTWETVCDDEFFHRRILAKYPKIEEYKWKNESWKHFFLRTITYISLMKEKFNDSEDYIKLFRDYQNNIDSILIETSELGELKFVKWSLKNGAKNDIEALMNASAYGHLEIVKYLVDQGVNIHARNNEALILASAYGYLEIVKYLVEQGANIHAVNEKALRMASFYGYLEIVKFLVEQGANIHALNDEALRKANLKKHTEIAKYLKSKSQN